MAASSEDWQTKLQAYIESYDWVGTIRRIYTHPEEVPVKGPQDRCALHIACEHDAPALVVQTLLSVYPQACSMVGTSNMNPLHITCSSSHASVDVVKVLLEGGSGKETSAQDVDGDAPLHAACRCGAPIEVLEILLRWDPDVVQLKDYEALSPLHRLWVRYYIILGCDKVESISSANQIVGDLREAWIKSKLLLKVAYHGKVDLASDVTFRVVHAASFVDCPRVVLRIAALLFPEQLEMRDENHKTPLLIAISAPIYKVHDLSEDGYDMNRMYGMQSEQDPEDQSTEDFESEDSNYPSVINILLERNHNPARMYTSNGQLPLCYAILKRKTWKNGLQAILEAYPDALSKRDNLTGFYPFMLAASVDYSLDIIYQLLRLNPELVRSGIREIIKEYELLDVTMAQDSHT